MSIDDIVYMYQKGYKLEEKDYTNRSTIITAQTAASTAITSPIATSVVATWRLYYTINPCGSGYNSSLHHTKDGGASTDDGTIQVPCEVDYNTYVIETFVNYLIRYYGLLDTDIIYVTDVLYTKRWTCATTTGICSQIDGPGYASKATCIGIWPCNPNQWRINGANGLTGTVTVSGNILTWSVIPKGETEAITFDFGNYGYTPIVYTDTAGVDQIGVYIPEADAYAINTSYHGGTADRNVPNSYAITTISNIAGFVKQISFSAGSANAAGSGSGALIGIVGVVALGMMMTAKKP
jgi:hypothetical protein